MNVSVGAAVFFLCVYDVIGHKRKVTQMETKSVAIAEAVVFGWEAMKKNFGFFIGPVLVFLVVAGMQFISRLAEDDHLGLLFLELIGFLLSMVVSMGLIRISLKFCDNEKASFGDLFSCFPLFFRYFISTVLYCIIVCVGLILLIFPGVIWAIKFAFYDYFIVDKGLGSFEALEASSRITMGVKGQLLGFFLIIVLISALGLLCLLVGLFVALPTIFVAQALIYRKLLAQTEAATPSVAQ